MAKSNPCEPDYEDSLILTSQKLHICAEFRSATRTDARKPCFLNRKRNFVCLNLEKMFKNYGNTDAFVLQ